jgi:acyl dehydratase
MFKTRIVHDILSAVLVPNILTRLFGLGNICASITMKYISAVRTGDTVSAKLRITSIGKCDFVTVETKMLNQDGRVVLAGVNESDECRSKPRSECSSCLI